MGNSLRIENDVLTVLSRAEVNGNALTLTGQLDRSLYLKTNKVLEAAGGKWNRKLKAHIFDADAAERIDQIILTGEVEIPRDEFDYFPSPPAVVDRLVELADIRAGMTVLEPSAGRGAIALRCADAGAEVHCVELMRNNCDVLVNSKKLCKVQQEDFLSIEPDRAGFDRVIMNPPFSRGADVKHVLHAHKFLKPDGLLVSVMSAGVTFRSDKRTTEFREFVESKGGEIEPLPDGAFKESGTMVRTVIVTIPA